MVGRATGPLVGAMLLTNRDPDAAQYDDEGHMLSRPMLVPAVAEGLTRWTTPLGKRRAVSKADESEVVEDENGELTPGFSPIGSRRMGTFTPISRTAAEPPQDEELARERSDYASDLREEGMEQRITTTLQAEEDEQTGKNDPERVEDAAARLERSAEMLERAADAMRMFGELRVSGTDNVASVMGDVVRGLATEHSESGAAPTTGVDNFAAAGMMAQVMGMTPPADGSAPIRENLARFGLFLNQAMSMGLSPERTEQVAREVKSTPDRSLSPETRENLMSFATTKRGLPQADADREVTRLESSARRLPDEIVAYGTIAVPAPSLRVEPQVEVKPNIPLDASSDPDADNHSQRQTGNAVSDSERNGEG